MFSNWFKKESKLFDAIHVMVDILLVCLGLWTAFALKESQGFAVYHKIFCMVTVPISVLAAAVFFHIYGVFKCEGKSYRETIFSVFLALAFVNVFTMALTLLFKAPMISITTFLFAFLFQFTYLLIWKHIVFVIYPVFYRPKTALIFSTEDDILQMTEKVLAKSKNFFEMKYICKELNQETYQLMQEVDVVIISSSTNNNHKEAIVSYCMEIDKTIYMIPELFEISLFNAKMAQFDDMPVFCIENLHLSIEQRFLKRTFDIVMALVFILLSLPVMIAAYIGIKLCDGGPAIFAQERVTRWNKKFKLYKFRTMTVDAEKYTGPVLATDKDPRITPIGALLRTTRIDELPQFFNVLMGDMSIVGPRPERQHFIAKFEQEIPDFGYRLATKAGITGLAQVLGKYTTRPKDKLRYDLLYIRNYSFGLDIKIILQTIKIMFMKVSSQGVETEKMVDKIEKESLEIVAKKVVNLE